ncbi:hypothetical protein B0O99DRAFT_645014, partial [Bisporella sp. PMI_857]
MGRTNCRPSSDYTSILHPKATTATSRGFFLMLSRQVSIVQLRLALEAVVSAHSALRTRFHCDAQGVWQQQVTDDVAGSFERLGCVASTREMINFRRGPILAAALVSVGDEQSVFFAAHHLVIDLVSWRIILLEIEELLVHGTAPAPEQTFPDRPTPAVFSEGHGREPWDASIDLSRTVGWFTTMYPVLVKPSQLDEGVIGAVCAAKDARRSLVDNGWPYFSTAFLTDAGRKAFAAHWPMEILFNYQGHQKKASLHWIFNVSATVKDGRLEASLTYNKHIRQPNMVKEWARRYEAALEKLAT